MAKSHTVIASFTASIAACGRSTYCTYVMAPGEGFVLLTWSDTIEVPDCGFASCKKGLAKNAGEARVRL